MPAGVIQWCAGRVMHARSRPVENRFDYPIFCVRVRVDRMPDVARSTSWLFGVDCRRAVSFQSRDHGGRDGGDLMVWLRARLAQAGVQMEVGAVWLQAFPRVLGYVFNPVSFWYVHDAQGHLKVLLADVNNTFGERHQYVLQAPGGLTIEADTRLDCRKVFHVSPFCETRGRYRFALAATGDMHRVAIDYFDDERHDRPLLKTAVWCRGAALTNTRVVSALLRAPFQTFGVMARIHWQALKLWLRRVRYVPKPRPPENDVSHNIEVNHEIQ